MQIIKTQLKQCQCCMNIHDIYTVQKTETNIFKGISVNYEATYEYCDQKKSFIEVQDMRSQNDISMKNAYRKKMNLLTTDEIYEVRRKYDITQSDLSNILGWGEKTITRYEGHQVQDIAHDSILRKIDTDPDWFLSFLEMNKEKLNEIAYEKYYNTAMLLFEKSQDEYLRKALRARCAKYTQKLCSYEEIKKRIDEAVEKLM